MITPIVDWVVPITKWTISLVPAGKIQAISFLDRKIREELPLDMVLIPTRPRILFRKLKYMKSLKVSTREKDFSLMMILSSLMVDTQFLRPRMILEVPWTISFRPIHMPNQEEHSAKKTFTPHSLEQVQVVHKYGMITLMEGISNIDSNNSVEPYLVNLHLRNQNTIENWFLLRKHVSS